MTPEEREIFKQEVLNSMRNEFHTLSRTREDTFPPIISNPVFMRRAANKIKENIVERVLTINSGETFLVAPPINDNCKNLKLLSVTLQDMLSDVELKSFKRSDDGEITIELNKPALSVVYVHILLRK